MACAAAGVLPADRLIIDLPSANLALKTALTRLRVEETLTTTSIHRGSAPVAARSLQAIATMEQG